MSVYIRLNRELNPTTLIKQISKEISKYNGKLEDSFLCIDIRPAQDTVAHIAKNHILNNLENNND